MEPVSPALAGGFLPIAHQEVPWLLTFKGSWSTLLTCPPERCDQILISQEYMIVLLRLSTIRLWESDILYWYFSYNLFHLWLPFYFPSVFWTLELCLHWIYVCCLFLWVLEFKKFYKSFLMCLGIKFWSLMLIAYLFLFTEYFIFKIVNILYFCEIKSILFLLCFFLFALYNILSYYRGSTEYGKLASASTARDHLL